MIYKLKNSKFSCEIDSVGAQLISLKDSENIEYIWQRMAPFWQNCTPVLFPVVGRPLNEVITVDGKDYPMELHGFTTKYDFALAKQTDNMLSLYISDNEETKISYPYSFKLFVNFYLDDTGVKTEMVVKNTDEKDIFFGIGGHPGITCPLVTGEKFEDYFIEFDQEYQLHTLICNEEVMIIPTSSEKIPTVGKILPLERKLFSKDAMIIENPPFDRLKVCSRKSGKGVEFLFENFTAFAMWSQYPEESPFICLEPWNGMGKRAGEGTELKLKKDIIRLEKDDSFICSYTINPLQ